MRLILLFAAAAVCGASCASNHARVPARLPSNQIALAGVRIGDPSGHIVRKFGMMIQQDISAYPVFCQTEISVKFEAAEAELCDDRVVNLITREPKYATPTGIRVGMSLADVTRSHGVPETLGWETGNGFAYRSQDRETALILHVEDGTIVAVEIWSDFT